MSGQLLELVFFGVLAFIICSKLISMVGKTSDRDNLKENSSFFGEPRSVKDVYYKEESAEQRMKRFEEEERSFTKLIAEGHREVLNYLQEVEKHVEHFTLGGFVRGAKKAFFAIITSIVSGDKSSLENLVDKRYLKLLDSDKEKSKKYQAFKSNDFFSDIDAKVSEIYFFGNSIFIKVLFSQQNKNKLVQAFHEEWTFSRNSLVKNNHWYLSNIDVVGT